MIQPVQKDAAFLKDIEAAREEPVQLHLWWLGQSGFLLQWQGKHVLFDPYLSDSLTHKYAGTDKPHERLTERVVAAGELDFIDLVTSSHNHTDHLDAETLVPLAQANPRMTLVFPEANRDTVVERLDGASCSLVGLNAGETIEAAGIRLTGIPAAHNTLDMDDSGRCRFLGFAVEWGPWTVYFSGDTLWHPHLVPALKRFAIDVAILPINGNVPERRVAGNLGGRESAQLAQEIGAGCAVPCHYEMFAFNTVSPKLFERSCRELGQPHRVPRAGERVSFDRD